MAPAKSFLSRFDLVRRILPGKNFPVTARARPGARQAVDL